MPAYISFINRIIKKFYSKKFSRKHSPVFKARRLAKKQLSRWHELLGKIRNALPSYMTHDYTNLKNDVSYSLEILLHKNLKDELDGGRVLIESLGGRVYYLYFVLSILSPYYYYYVVEMGYSKTSRGEYYIFKEPVRFNKEHKLIIKVIEKIVKEYGYRKLSREAVRKIIPAVRTDLKDAGEATVYNCLFGDLVGPKFHNVSIKIK